MDNDLKLKIYVFLGLLTLFIVVLVFTHTKDCGSDEACFNKYAVDCKKVEAKVSKQNNLFFYEVQGKQKDTELKCIVKITLLKSESNATPTLRTNLEGKGMVCTVPQKLLKEKGLSDIENINDYCSGPLKEALLQISLENLYTVVVKNIGSLALQFSQSLSDLNTSEANP